MHTLLGSIDRAPASLKPSINDVDDLNDYWIGTQRTLGAFQRWAGVNFNEQTISNEARAGRFQSAPTSQPHPHTEHGAEVSFRALRYGAMYFMPSLYGLRLVPGRQSFNQVVLVIPLLPPTSRKVHAWGRNDPAPPHTIIWCEPMTFRGGARQLDHVPDHQQLRLLEPRP